MRILIAEDDIDMLSYLKSRLIEKCFAVDATTDGEDALSQAKINEYDILLLDYSLPGKTGFEICDSIRRDGKSIPVIIISGTLDIKHKVEGFMLGIDDYVIKPFYFDEVYARILAILRRPKTMQDTVLRIDNLTLDTVKQQVTRAKKSIYLTRKEFALLEYLMRHSGMVVSRGTIMEHIWDISLDPFSNTIETHILNLRKKIDHPPYKKLIHCIPGRGYKIDLNK